MAPVIALLTDFGLRDPYVGIMKGVILGIAPDVRIVDLSHETPAQAVLQGAFLLEVSWRYFPAGAIFVAIVDPGVGSVRRRLALQREGFTFIGPDNGILSTCLPPTSRGERRPGAGYDLQRVRLDGDLMAVSIENAAVMRPSVSATFEGRDAFAPAAAYLAAGGALADLGPRVTEMQAFPQFRAPADSGRIRGTVLHSDTYGNLITDIPNEAVTPATRFRCAGREVALVRTYADAPAQLPVAIAGSCGYVEIAVANGNAAASLGATVGASVDEVSWASRTRAVKSGDSGREV